MRGVYVIDCLGAGLVRRMERTWSMTDCAVAF